ncbi:hypothetical protein EC991_003778 [Linnemannia zychae]|nr:hypothetical protein EC991_003778 [Linnemannia zychae]
MSFPDGPMSLPAEILAIVFCYLTRKELHHCLFVSQLWHSEAEARLYKNITLNPLYERHDSLIPALMTRKSLIRRVQWNEVNQRTPAADLYNILLGYRPDDIITINNNGGLDHPTMRQLVPPPHRPGPPSIAPPPRNGKMSAPNHAMKAYGHNHHNTPTLTQLSYVGDLYSLKVLESVIFHATNLTVLELNFLYTSLGSVGAFIVDVEKILATLPLLKELSVSGPKHVYPAMATPSKDEGGDYLASLELMSGITALTTNSTTRAPLYRLELFTFDRPLMRRQGPGAFLFFSRLGNLTRIVVRSPLSSSQDIQDCRPWDVGRALRDHCPKIESIEMEGIIPLWLFDLPARISDSSVLSGKNSYLQVITQLMEKDRRELLEGRTAAEPFFPQLKSLVARPGHTLSAQDLILLGVQAQFLTHVEIYVPHSMPRVWKLYDKEAVAASANANAAANISVPDEDSYMEDRRLGRRGPICGRDVALFLRHCSSLRCFRLSGAYFVYYQDLTDTLETFTTVRTFHNSITRTKRMTKATPIIQPWACERTLETLKIRLITARDRPEEHALIWKHLGRLKKLRSLTLIPMTYSLKQSSPISSPDLVVEGLVEGGMKDRLEEIHLGAWWEVKDRRGMVLWFAKAFPRLKVLGLGYRADYVKGETGKMHTAFLQDEAVKRLIPRVFVENAKDF